jgi:hypothetical protein
MPLSLLLCPSPSRLPTMSRNSRLPEVGAPAGGRGRHGCATRHPSHRRAYLRRDGTSGRVRRRNGDDAGTGTAPALRRLGTGVGGGGDGSAPQCPGGERGMGRRAGGRVVPRLTSHRGACLPSPRLRSRSGSGRRSTPLRPRARGRTTVVPAPCPEPVRALEPPPWPLPPSSRPRAPSHGLRRREAGRGGSPAPPPGRRSSRGRREATVGTARCRAGHGRGTTAGKEFLCGSNSPSLVTSNRRLRIQSWGNCWRQS